VKPETMHEDNWMFGGLTGRHMDSPFYYYAIVQNQRAVDNTPAESTVKLGAVIYL